MKKITIILGVLCVLFMTGCGAKEKNIEGSLEDIMTKVYEGIKEEDLPMMLANTKIDDQNIESYLGIKDISYVDGIASESQVGSIAHSVVLLRMSEDADIEKTKETIKKNANPRKWICVEASNVYVESNGNLVILIMSNENADMIKTNFLNLK